eukprot:gene5344-5731_t
MSVQVPSQFICPITREIMVDPVIDPNGISYEREAIMKWIELQQTSPFTRDSCLSTQLVPNRALKELIETFKRNHCGQLDDYYVADSKDVWDSAHVFAVPCEEKCPEAKLEAKATTENIHVKPLMIYVVINTSRSMQEPCGDPYYSCLDLVKHTVHQLISALSDNNYVCVIKSGKDADVFIPLKRVTENMKKSFMARLNYIPPENQGNLWDGIRLAIDEISSHGNIVNEYNLQVYVLTDGKSNNIPSHLLTNVIKSYLELKCSHLQNYPMINTFGYGYNVDSDLLLSISTASNGFFGFIPDATKVGTVFIHALSNSIVLEKPILDRTSQSICDKLMEILNQILTKLDYIDRLILLDEFNTFLDKVNHQHFLPIIDFIEELKADCSSSRNPNEGQISKAIEQRNFYYWGVHYLRSVISAYRNHICINFNDKGIQRFKTPRFMNELRRIENIFIRLPSPRSFGRVMGNYPKNYTVRGRYSNELYLPCTSPPVNITSYYANDDDNDNDNEGSFIDDCFTHSSATNLSPLVFHSDEENESDEDNEENLITQNLLNEKVEIIDEVIDINPALKFNSF